MNEWTDAITAAQSINRLTSLHNHGDDEEVQKKKERKKKDRVLKI